MSGENGGGRKESEKTRVSYPKDEAARGWVVERARELSVRSISGKKQAGSIKRDGRKGDLGLD